MEVEVPRILISIEADNNTITNFILKDIEMTEIIKEMMVLNKRNHLIDKWAVIP